MGANDAAEALFQRAFRSGIASSYNLSPQSSVINEPESFYSTFQRYVAIWNPNIPLNTTSRFPGVNRLVRDFPLRQGLELRENLTKLCIISPFDSFGRAISCLSLPYISLGLADAPSSDLDIAAKYGVYPEDAGAAAVNVTITLASYFARANNRESMCAMRSLLRNDTALDLKSVAECMRPAICRNAPSVLRLSPDIIGIGVWTAYFIQVGICFVAPILAILLQYLIKRSMSSHPESQTSRSARKPSTETEPEKKLSTSSLQNLHAAFTTGLVDFQKAQCYYMLAIQAASISTLHRTAAEGTIVQRQATSTVIRVVAILGTVAPTVILLCLMILEQRSWYILLLTIATAALSISVFFDAEIMRIPDRLFKSKENQDSRYNIDPFSLCSIKLSGEDPIWHRDPTTWAIYLSALILAIIAVDHVIHLRLPRAKERLYLRPYTKIQRNLESLITALLNRRTTSFMQINRRILLYIFIAVITTSFYILSQVIISLQSYYSDMKVSHEWSFGQIISVAIWIPVVVDWLQLSFRGMESGSEYRLPDPWRVKDIGLATSKPLPAPDLDDVSPHGASGTDLEDQVFLGVHRRTATVES